MSKTVTTNKLNTMSPAGDTPKKDEVSSYRGAVKVPEIGLAFDFAKRRSDLATAIVPPGDRVAQCLAASKCKDRSAAAERLASLETSIANGVAYALEAGKAIDKIRKQKLYLLTHATFEEYLKETWNYSRSYGYKLCNFAKAVEEGTAKEGDTPTKLANKKKGKGTAACDDDSGTVSVKAVNVALAKVSELEKIMKNSLNANEVDSVLQSLTDAVVRILCHDFPSEKFRKEGKFCIIDDILSRKIANTYVVNV